MGWCADNCDKYGELVQVSSKNQINVNRALKNCIAGSQPSVPYYCVKQQFRRLEEEDEESSEERELSATCPLNGFSDGCQKRLTKPNGSCKSGKKAVCTLCSACTDYNSGWCADNCDQYGERVQVSNKNKINVNNALKNCIAGSQPSVPYYCVKQQFRRLEEEDEESSEERELSATCPLNGFNAGCQKRLTKPNGSCKSGKKAVCTLCSACDNYNSGWCADNCDQYGERVQVSNKNTINVNRALKNCIAGDTPHVPYYCVKQQFRRLEEDEE